MPALLIPPRRRGVEILDAPDVDPALVTRSLADVVRANALFGGLSAVLDEIKQTIADLPRCATLLDVGTGLGDIPCRARVLAQKNGVDLTTIGLDSALELTHASKPVVSFTVCGDALRLPFADRSVDIVMCSQVLHHFAGIDALTLLREMNRVARVRVVVSDLRRSWIAAAGLWLASFPLRFHAVSRHDGVVSVLRGFTPEELSDTVNEAVAKKPLVRRRRGFRVTASWAPCTTVTGELARPFDLGPMPIGRPMETVDESFVRAPVQHLFELARNVEKWPSHLPHYRYVRFRERRADGGGLVEMSAYRPFYLTGTPNRTLRINWPTWWLSEMSVDRKRPAIRFRHVGGITKGMDVEWTFVPAAGGTHVRIVHLWDGPGIPVVGKWAAKLVIGPVFVHGIASRTLAGLAAVAERKAITQS